MIDLRVCNLFQNDSAIQIGLSGLSKPLAIRP